MDCVTKQICVTLFLRNGQMHILIRPQPKVKQSEEELLQKNCF